MGFLSPLFILGLTEPAVDTLLVYSGTSQLTDSHETDEGTAYKNVAQNNVNPFKPYAAFRVENAMGIPNGAIILRADLQLRFVTYDDPDLYIYAELNAAPAALKNYTESGSTNDISNRTLTTGRVLWQQTNAGTADYALSPDFSGVVQEVVDDGSWDESGQLVIILEQNGETGKIRYQSDNQTANWPILTIEWEAVNADRTLALPLIVTETAFYPITLIPDKVLVMPLIAAPATIIPFEVLGSPTPGARIYQPAAEDRSFRPAADDRAYNVAAEDRSYRPAAEDRRYTPVEDWD